MYNKIILFVNKIVFCFLFENNKNKKRKMKFGKYKGRKTMEKFGNNYNLEIGLGFCG